MAKTRCVFFRGPLPWIELLDEHHHWQCDHQCWPVNKSDQDSPGAPGCCFLEAAGILCRCPCKNQSHCQRWKSQVGYTAKLYEQKNIYSVTMNRAIFLKGFIPAWPSLLQSGCNPCVFCLDKGLAELNSEKCTWLVTLRKLSDNDINHCWLNNTYLERSDTNKYANW